MRAGTSDVVIVGGGIGGLAAALALAREGVAVEVIEQASEFGEIGAGIQLAPNAQRVLDILGVADVIARDAVRPANGLIMSAQNGEVLTRIDFGQPFRERFRYPYMVMHRSDLLQALLDGCRDSGRVVLTNDFRVDDVREEGDRVIVSTANGQERTAGLVIGADGLWSVARGYVVGEQEPICSGDVAYRGAAPIERVSVQAGEDNVVWWIGPDKHLMQYPIRRGELFNQVAVFTSRLFAEGAKDWGGVDELDEHFVDTAPDVRAALQLIERDRSWQLNHRLPIDRWTRGRVVLLGDSAHPMLQYMAQGACQALEDAVVFARVFAAHDGDHRVAYPSYEAARIERTAQVQRWSQRMGEIVHFSGVAGTVRDELLRGRSSTDYRYLEWVYGYDAGTVPIGADAAQGLVG